ncbi:hypothetical protein L6V77_16395 [Myxococcota bacterium]|nr:hypothetical protein [Myxococcota bacterium]
MSRGSAAFEPLPADAAERVECYLEARFGLPRAALAGHRFWHRPGAPALWIAAADVVPPSTGQVLSIGLCAFRDPPPRGKPSNVFCLRFGAAATRRVCELDALPATATADYLAGVPLPMGDADVHGWVIVRCGGRVLGRGHLANGVLVGEMRRAWREALEPTVAG